MHVQAVSWSVGGVTPVGRDQRCPGLVNVVPTWAGTKSAPAVAGIISHPRQRAGSSCRTSLLPGCISPFLMDNQFLKPLPPHPGCHWKCWKVQMSSHGTAEKGALAGYWNSASPWIYGACCSSCCCFLASRCLKDVLLPSHSFICLLQSGWGCGLHEASSWHCCLSFFLISDCDAVVLLGSYTAPEGGNYHHSINKSCLLRGVGLHPFPLCQSPN